MQVTIIGNGAMATVCSIVLTLNGHQCTIWGANKSSIDRLKDTRENARLLAGVKFPDTVRLTADDEDCFNGAAMIVSAVPTQYLRSVWTRLIKHVPPGVPIVSISKGIENETLLRPTQVITEVLNDKGHSRSLAALSGPNIAAEMARYLPCIAVAASTDFDFAQRVQAAFRTQWFRVYTNTDVIGVELAGATKNVIAIAAGILDGLAAGNNAKAAVVTRGLVEITRLGVAMGARESTFQGPAGLGDLLTTCVSPKVAIETLANKSVRGVPSIPSSAKWKALPRVVPTTLSMVQLAEDYHVEMPITQAVHAVLFEGKDVMFALTDLMTRDPKPERAGVL